MTVVPLPVPPNDDQPPRPGSRADRMTRPLARDVLKALAEAHGVCVRPLAIRRTDTLTGETRILEVPCGARMAAKCKPCANRNRKLRTVQITEGWHRTDEPSRPSPAASEEVKAVVRFRATLLIERETLNYTPIPGTLEQAAAERARQRADLDKGIAEIDEWLATHKVRGTLATPHGTTTSKAGGDGDGDSTPAPSRSRVVRSTKRRKDAGELPSMPRQHRTVGRIYTGRAGHTHQPSMLITPTCDSYGEVHTGARTRRGRLQPCTCGALHGERDELLGTPIDPDSYDYHRAACDAIFFTAGLDRWWQNLRRAAGLELQYAGCVEPQRRLAPHAHFAMRGTLPRKLIQDVTAATYHQVWWPAFGPDHQLYTTTRPPMWDSERRCYIDPDTRHPLPGWDDVVSGLIDPAYVFRFGRVDARGVKEGSKDAHRSVRYVTKYLVKDMAEAAKVHSQPQRAHADRLLAELSVLPCSPICANWLLYGVQPKTVKADLIPGRCKGKVHQPATLGFTGRRILVSRRWSNKTLTDHREDARTLVRTLLAQAAQPATETGRDDQADDATPAQVEPGTEAATDSSRFIYQLARSDDPDVEPLQVRILRAIGLRHQWRDELRSARARAAARPAPAGVLSATQDPPTLPHAA